MGCIRNLPFTKLAILDNGTNKKQAIFALSIKLLQFIMEKDFQIPTLEAIESLMGKGLYQIWNALCLLIEHKYEMERLWNSGGRKWKYEYKYQDARGRRKTVYSWKLTPADRVHENCSQKKYKDCMMKQLFIMTVSGLCLS